MMTVQTALITAGCVFGIVAFVHLLRLIYKAEIMIGHTKIPQWVSVIGFILPTSLSAWMFMVNASL